MKKGEKFWCWWMSRCLYFRREYVNCSGATVYVFEDVAGAQFDLTESQVEKLERRV